MFPIKEVSDVMLAFPAGVVREGYLPAWDDIPKEFKDRGNNKWRDLFSKLFLTGGQSGMDLYLQAKSDADIGKAWRHINACMGSFEPKHEHKEAGVAFLFSEWFEDYEWKPKTKNDEEKDSSRVFLLDPRLPFRLAQRDVE